MSIFYLFLLHACLVCLAVAQEAQDCNRSKCKLPDCRCSGTDIPGGFSPKKVPQIVTVTFNEAITYSTDLTLERIFNGQFQSANGCPFRATHFVSHSNTDYTLANKWWRKGHEIGSFSITHRGNITYWAVLNSTGWHMEMDGMRKILNKFGKIPLDEIVGMRAPDLQNGGDLQFLMMARDGFLYDGSMPTLTYGGVGLSNGLWPYSFDYKSTQDCEILPCVYSSFPGIWEMPILTLEGDDGRPCSYVGGCIGGFPDSTPDAAFNFLLRNFNRTYNGNRAPFGLHTEVGDFSIEFLEKGLMRLLAYLSTLPDVYVVTLNEALHYARNPVDLDAISSFPEFDCAHIPRPEEDCDFVSSCRYDDTTLPPELQGLGERYVKVCGFTCPDRYPWIDNPFGN